MDERRCCRACVGPTGSFASPFGRLVATGWYDGPTHGVVECASCHAVYAFEQLDANEGEDLRVFALAPTRASFAQIDSLEPIDPTRSVTVLLGDDSRSPKSDFVEHCIAAAAPPEFVVATLNLCRTVELWRPFPTPTPSDWFSALGLSRAPIPDDDPRFAPASRADGPHVGSSLRALVGRTVVNARVEHGLFLAFEDGTKLAILNPWSWIGRDRLARTPSVGSRCVDASEESTSATLRFDDESTLTIDLRDSAFTGPEAMVLRLANGQLVVWN